MAWQWMRSALQHPWSVVRISLQHLLKSGHGVWRWIDQTFSGLWSCRLKWSAEWSTRKQEHRWDRDKTFHLQIYSSMEIMMNPTLKVFRERTILTLHEYGIGRPARNGLVLISGRGKKEKSHFANSKDFIIGQLSSKPEETSPSSKAGLITGRRQGERAGGSAGILGRSITKPASDQN